MVQQADELAAVGEPGQGSGHGPINLASLVPGGIAPEPQETAVAVIVLAALGFVILMRRGFGSVLSK